MEVFAVQVQCLVLEVTVGVSEVILHSLLSVVRLALVRGRHRCHYYCCRWNLLRAGRQLKGRRHWCPVRVPSVLPQRFLEILRNVMVIMEVMMMDQTVGVHCP